MAISLYDATIPSYLQILRAVDGLLDKAAAFCDGSGEALETLVAARIADDMLPFGYQVKSCVAHSVGAIEAARSGTFSPDMTPWPEDIATLRDMIRGAIATIEGMDRTEIDDLADRKTEFRFRDTVMPFTVPDFLLSFAQPNFYFHATTAYAILRMKGVPLGKRDFLGMVRLDR